MEKLTREALKEARKVVKDLDPITYYGEDDVADIAMDSLTKVIGFTPDLDKDQYRLPFLAILKAIWNKVPGIEIRGSFEDCNL